MKLMSIKNAAKKIGVGDYGIREAVKRGEISVYKVGVKKVKVDFDEVVNWIRKPQPIQFIKKAEKKPETKKIIFSDLIEAQVFFMNHFKVIKEFKYDLDAGVFKGATALYFE